MPKLLTKALPLSEIENEEAGFPSFTDLARFGCGVHKSIEVISGLGARRLVVVVMSSSSLGLTFDRDESDLVAIDIVDSGGGGAGPERPRRRGHCPQLRVNLI